MGLLSNGLAQTLPVVRRFCFLFLVFFLLSFGLRDSLFDTRIWSANRLTHGKSLVEKAVRSNRTTDPPGAVIAKGA